MKTLLLSLLLISSYGLKAQIAEDEKAVKAVVVQLFEGMQRHDSTMMRTCFHPSARMQSIGKNRKTGNIELTTENSIDGFLKQIGSLPTNITIQESVLNYEIKIDAQMATAWTPYELYVNQKRQHCGVDAFQFFKTDKGWKIIAITDTRRVCE
jgi:hypothetical protein